MEHGKIHTVIQPEHTVNYITQQICNRLSSVAFTCFWHYIYQHYQAAPGQLFHFFYYFACKKNYSCNWTFYIPFCILLGVSFFRFRFDVIVDQSRKQLPVVYLNGVHYGGYNNFFKLQLKRFYWLFITKIFFSFAMRDCNERTFYGT